MTGRLEFVTRTAEATRRLGAAIAELLAAGDVVALSGELGAGKTCLVQGMARGLGIEAPVTSPTFMLQRTYHGRLDLVHLDVYRLDRLQDVMDLGDDVLAADVLTVVEWGDAIASLLPDDRLDIELRHPDGVADPDDPDDPDDPGTDAVPDLPRRVVVVARGRWAQRCDELAAVGSEHAELLPRPGQR